MQRRRRGGEYRQAGRHERREQRGRWRRRRWPLPCARGERSSVASRPRKKAGKMASSPNAPGSPIASPPNTPITVPPTQPGYCGMVAPSMQVAVEAPAAASGKRPRGIDDGLALRGAPGGAARERGCERHAHREKARVEEGAGDDRCRCLATGGQHRGRAELGRAGEYQRRHHDRRYRPMIGRASTPNEMPSTSPASPNATPARSPGRRWSRRGPRPPCSGRLSATVTAAPGRLSGTRADRRRSARASAPPPRRAGGSARLR